MELNTQGLAVVRKVNKYNEWLTGGTITYSMKNI
jgi:hypothetical protein